MPLFHGLLMGSVGLGIADGTNALIFPDNPLFYHRNVIGEICLAVLVTFALACGWQAYDWTHRRTFPKTARLLALVWTGLAAALMVFQILPGASGSWFTPLATFLLFAAEWVCAGLLSCCVVVPLWWASRLMLMKLVP